MRTVAIIPARYASSRLPGKPLLDVGGKPMIHRVYDQVSRANRIDQLIIATDDQRIFQYCVANELNVRMTSEKHPNGTSRIIEVAEQLEAELVLNVQGDEPFIDPNTLDLLVQGMENNADIGTLAKRNTSPRDYNDPNCVKVVCDPNFKALYFSRSAIPYASSEFASFYQHIGVYAFQRETLMDISTLALGNLSAIESLEQLTWLENGLHIQVMLTEESSMGIDTPEDLIKANEIWKERTS